jgi:hypothetical protein
MTTNIQLLRSSIAYKRPSAAPLLEGQAAINYNAAEPGLFFRLTDGRLAKVGPTAVTDNGLAPNAAPAGEVGNSVGETWLNAQVSLYSPVGYVFDGNEFVTANGFKVDLATGDFTLMRTLTVQKLVTNELNIDGPAVIGGNITPNGQNCAYFLGKTDERWDYAYLCNLDVSKDGLIGNDFTVVRDTDVGRDFTVGRHVASNLVPDAGITRFLGNASNQWAGVHTKDFWSYGNTSIGSNCTSILTVNATSTFKCGVTFEQPVNINQIGNSCSDTLTVNATTTFKCPVTFEGLITLPPTAIPNPIFSGDILLGDGCATSTIDLNGAVTLSCDMMPKASNAQSIGSTAKRLRALYATDIYTGDLHLKNEKGDWTMIEDEDYLTIRNNKTGKTFKLLMEEV